MESWRHDNNCITKFVGSRHSLLRGHIASSFKAKDIVLSWNKPTPQHGPNCRIPLEWFQQRGRDLDINSLENPAQFLKSHQFKLIAAYTARPRHLSQTFLAGVHLWVGCAWLIISQAARLFFTAALQMILWPTLPQLAQGSWMIIGRHEKNREIQICISLFLSWVIQYMDYIMKTSSHFCQASAKLCR